MLDGYQQRVVLAHASPFTLGRARFEPPHRLVSNESESIVVEPRVMQLFVALARANGAVLSRDDLIDQCWGGRIVGDNAIQRAVSQARRIAERLGKGAFGIETIKGVGYRLCVADSRAAVPPGPEQIEASGDSRFSRRTVLATGGGAAVAAAAAYAVFLAPGERPTAMALELYAQGEAARRGDDGIPGEQAIALYSEAVRESPSFAAAWGGLALAYCDLLNVTDADQLGRVASLAVSAARRALEIEPANIDARLAMLAVRPAFRRWQEAQAQAATVARDGRRSWPVRSYLGRLAASTGRSDAAIAHYRRALEIEPLLPRVHGALAYASWASGRLHDADRLLEKGTQRWPRSWWLWNARFQFLAFEGETEAAVRQVTDESQIPWNLSSQALPKRVELARAIGTRAPEDIRRSKETHIAEARQHERSTWGAALALAALDQRDELLELLRGYYLGVGRYPTVITPFSRRPTWFLYLPPLRSLHSDPRFADLLRVIGLT